MSATTRKLSRRSLSLVACRAVVLSDLLAALLLFTVISVPLSSSLSTLGRTATKIHRVHQASLQEAQLENLLRQILNGHDSHRLPLYPRVHKGAVLFTDGALLPTDPVKSGITGIELAAAHLARVMTHSPNDPTHMLTFCTLHHLPLPSPMHGFIAVGMDSFAELQGPVYPQGDAGCYRGQLEKVRSLTVPPFSITNDSFHLLLPIRRQFTLLHLDDGSLRYLSHEGEITIENQPLSEHWSQIRLEPTISGKGLTLEVNATLDATSFGAQPPLRLTLTSHLSRRIPWNVLLHGGSTRLGPS